MSSITENYLCGLILVYGLEDIVLKDPGSFIDNNGRINVSLESYYMRLDMYWDLIMLISMI
jgi:hypothetical protein